MARRVTKAEQLIGLLRGGPLTYEQIARRLGVTQRAAYQAVYRAKRAGKVRAETVVMVA